MTTELREALSDLAAGVAPYVVREDLGRTAWSIGRRRRWRRRIVRTVFALVVAAFVATSVFPGAVLVMPAGPPPQLAPDDPGPVVDGYPQRIGHQWRIGPLPDHPGPLAALLQTGTHWYGVSPTGVRWLLATTEGDQPTLSPTGRYLGYLESADGPYVLRDLVTGTRTQFPAVGLSDRSPCRLTGDSPGFWSPDGRHLAVRATLQSEQALGVLVLGVDGSDYFNPRTGGVLAGWADPDALVWLRASSSGGPVIEFDLLYGTTARQVALNPNGSFFASEVDEWRALTSPDGQQLLVLTPLQSSMQVHWFSTVTGDEIRLRGAVDGPVHHCPPAWAGPDAALAATQGADVNAVRVSGFEVRPLAVVEPGLGSRCLVWAAGALTATPHGAPWGTSQVWVGWWWREIVAVSLLVAASIWYVVWLRRRRLSTKDRG